MDDLIEEVVERQRTDNRLDPVDEKEEKRNLQCFGCVRHISNYKDDGAKFCGPDPTTWYYHECTLKPNEYRSGEFQNCMHVNPDGECKDFQPSGIIFKPDWTYRDLNQYRKHLQDRHAEMDRERGVYIPYSSNRSNTPIRKPSEVGYWLVIVGIIILLALAAN